MVAGDARRVKAGVVSVSLRDADDEIVAEERRNLSTCASRVWFRAIKHSFCPKLDMLLAL
jgi:hypothetical protein